MILEGFSRFWGILSEVMLYVRDFTELQRNALGSYLVLGITSFLFNFNACLVLFAGKINFQGCK